MLVVLSQLPIVEAHNIVCSPFCFSFLAEEEVAVEAEAAEASEEEVVAEAVDAEASEEEVAAEEEAAVDGKFIYCLLQAEEENLSGK